jgi:hypothetical protein
MKCNALILPNALALLLVVQLVASREVSGAFEKDIDESVRSLTKSYHDEDWSVDNNEDKLGLIRDEVDADVVDVEESLRRLKGKKGKKPRKEKTLPPSEYVPT